MGSPPRPHDSEGRFAAFFHQSPDSVVLLDPHDPDLPLRIVDCNEAAARLRGLTREEMLGRSINEFSLHPHAPALVLSRIQSLREGGIIRGEDDHRRRDGTLVPVEYSSTLVLIDGREYILGIARDISARRRLEEEHRRTEARLADVQRLESLGLLASGVAHDFKNLLTTIVGHASLAAHQLPADNPAQEHLEQIAAGVHAATDLCRQLLMYAGRGHHVKERVNLVEITEDVSRLLAVSLSPDSRLEQDLPADLPPVQADAGQMRQILLNLIMNASDALVERRGVIRLTLRTAALDRTWMDSAVLSPVNSAGRFVLIGVADNGCGIEPATLKRIFEPFFSTKGEGRGLGLASVLGIVRGHGGGVRVVSRTGAGTTFEIALPLAA